MMSPKDGAGCEAEKPPVEKWRLNQDRCKGCGLCVEFCPKGCLEMSDSLNKIGYHAAVIRHAEDCTSCALCAQMCPETAIKIYRRAKVKNA